MPNRTKYVTTSGDLPTEPHWAIIKFTTVHIPGDERSRTHPGHGYPARSEAVVNYEAYDDEQDWLDAIQKIEDDNRRYSSTSYRAVKVEPVKVNTRIQVTTE